MLLPWYYFCTILSVYAAISPATAFLRLPPSCFTLRTSIRTNPTYQLNRYGETDLGESTLYNNLGDASSSESESDHGFELRVRRASDGVMVSGWYMPGRDYIVTLTNRFYTVGFQDAIIWMVKNMEETKKIMKPSVVSSTTNATLNVCRIGDTDEIMMLGRWIHRLSASRAHQTQSRAGCKGVTIEQPLSTYSNKHRRRHRSNLITHMSARWRAPQRPNPKLGCPWSSVPELECITLYAAVHTHGKRPQVYSHTGGLMKTLCPTFVRPPSPVLPAYMSGESGEHDSTQMESEYDQKKGEGRKHHDGMKITPKDAMQMDNMQPKDCCACGSATYNLTFTGLWTKDTHPKDWPIHNPGLLHWTNLIGASHMPSYQIYAMGDLASAGVQSVCTYGDTTVLKQTLGVAAMSGVGSISAVPTGTQRGAIGIGPLHSLLSTSGMWSEETLAESRSTLVGVNRTHSTISVVSMLGPSPGWCTGLSSQSVCQADCTWTKRLDIDLFPWDSGVMHGDTYVPKNTNRKDIPDPIRYITKDWMPNSPFTPHRPVARISLVRVLPEEPWQCTPNLLDGVELFQSDGSTKRVSNGSSSTLSVTANGGGGGGLVQSAMGPVVGGLPKKRRGKGGGTVISNGLAVDSPLSDPSLAQMATFLCITGEWSIWSRCSVTCGVGKRTRQREMVVNKKNELCQHVPLVQQERCEGRQRTCDFSSACSLFPWTEWSPCNATCTNRLGRQTRRRFLVQRERKGSCMHLLNSTLERDMGMITDQRECSPSDNDCDAITVCGEGRKDGVTCGPIVSSFHYSSKEHACIPFDYLGCKGGRNRFASKAECEQFCLPAIESLPAWRRERMALLQYKTSQIAADGTEQLMKPKKAAKHCWELMDPGVECLEEGESSGTRWYFSSRTRRCSDFFYLGCQGNKNRYENYSECISDCMPEEWHKLTHLVEAAAAMSKRVKSVHSTAHRSSSSSSSSSSSEDDGTRSGVEEEEVNGQDIDRIGAIWGAKEDCQVSKWSQWGPCSSLSASVMGKQFRHRNVIRPTRHGGRPCGQLYEKQLCVGSS